MGDTRDDKGNRQAIDERLRRMREMRNDDRRREWRERLECCGRMKIDQFMRVVPNEN